MSMPDKVLELVEVFHRNREAYLSGVYSEAQVRLEFIDPFFKALGWDIYNEKGYAEAYKDVIPEDAIKIGGAIKAPDYCFRIGGARKFFVEAKKPSVDLRDDISPAYQLRRYAWSGKLSLSILTDFEEFAVYDCRIKPVKTDMAATARTLYIPYTDYEKRWDGIASIFSRDEVLKGSFDKYAESTKRKRGTTEVDDAFLEEIESWRDMLARNIALRNSGPTTRELNYAVQRTIDRILFLRICEDRGIEDYGKLMALQNGVNVYPRLCDLFIRADERYNSGLFHFRHEKERPEAPDKLTLGLAIDDKVLKEIIKRLYYPDSPYEFSVLPSDILGQVYEQFLGKVIRLTPKHRAVVEDKPEVKKAGGVYYTPTYIVDYIVENTVGEFLKGKTPKTASKLRILDPACGSGSFLIGAYQHLIDWHRDFYVENDPDKWLKGRKPRIYEGPGGDWRLTTGERKRILLNNIYGVDIDPQAVEVTKLSLLLKVLEGENEETLQKQLQLFQERALPDLSSNIKCGNSLIGHDFYDNQQISFLDEEERYRINVFNWGTEFSEIMTAGGFDVVIGNPPYGVPYTNRETGYLLEHYTEASKSPDSYCSFMVKGLSLAKASGFLSFIVPNTFCDLENCDEFRLWLLDNHFLTQIWQSGWAFKAAVVDTLVFFIQNRKPKNSSISIIKTREQTYARKLLSFRTNNLYKIDYRNSSEDRILLNKVSNEGSLLGKVAIVKAGVKIYEKGKGTPFQTEETLKERPFTIKGTRPKGWRKLYRGKDIGRYAIAEVDEFIDYGPWLAAPRSPDLFEGVRILMRRTDYHLMACIEKEGAVAVNSCHVIKLKQDMSYAHAYILGILNSRLIQHIFALQNPQMVGKVFAEIKVVYVQRLPIQTIDFSNPSDVAHHNRMVNLVEHMLVLREQLFEANTANDKITIQRQIDATDRQIDYLVYELYGLTEEEIKIVEEANE